MNELEINAKLILSNREQLLKMNSPIEEFWNSLNTYVEARRKIRKYVLNPDSGLLTVADANAKDIIVHILKDDVLPEDELVRGLLSNDHDATAIDEYLGVTIPEQQGYIENVRDYFDNWFDPARFLARMYEIGVIILSSGKIPSFFDHYINEARISYGFGNDLATITLSRTILEIAVHHFQQLNEEKKSGHRIAETVFRLEHNSFSRNLNDLLGAEPDLKTRAKNLYLDASKIIHGNLFSNNRPHALSIFKDTLVILCTISDKLDLGSME